VRNLIEKNLEVKVQSPLAIKLQYSSGEELDANIPSIVEETLEQEEELKENSESATHTSNTDSPSKIRAESYGMLGSNYQGKYYA
jgi:hypothetical protein